METLSAEEWCFFMFRRLMLVFICVTDELACSVEYCGADLWGWQMKLLQLPIYMVRLGACTKYSVPPSGIMEWTLELEMVVGVATDRKVPLPLLHVYLVSGESNSQVGTPSRLGCCLTLLRIGGMFKRSESGRYDQSKKLSVIEPRQAY